MRLPNGHAIGANRRRRCSALQPVLTRDQPRYTARSHVASNTPRGDSAVLPHGGTTSHVHGDRAAASDQAADRGLRSGGPSPTRRRPPAP